MLQSAMRSLGAHTRLVTMIRESIAVLCKSSLFYESELSIEGLLGITLDGADVVLVNIREVFRPVDTGGGERTGDVRPVTACRRGDSPPPAAKPVTACRHGDSPPPAKCRRRRRSPTPPPAAVTADSISEPDCVVIKDEADDADWAGDSSVVDSYLGAAILQPEEFKTERMGGINAGSELPTTADDRLPQPGQPGGNESLSSVDCQQTFGATAAAAAAAAAAVAAAWHPLDGARRTWDWPSTPPVLPGGQNASPSAGRHTASDPSGTVDQQTTSGPDLDTDQTNCKTETHPSAWRGSWPDTFDLPLTLFHPNLQQSLVSSWPLTRSLKTALISAVYQKMTQYTLYPTPRQYRSVSELIVSQFPYLRDPTPGLHGYEAWGHRLSEKFRNERRRMDCRAVVMRRRRCHLIAPSTDVTPPQAADLPPPPGKLGDHPDRQVQE